MAMRHSRSAETAAPSGSSEVNSIKTRSAIFGALALGIGALSYATAKATDTDPIAAIGATAGLAGLGFGAAAFVTAGRKRREEERVAVQPAAEPPMTGTQMEAYLRLEGQERADAYAASQGRALSFDAAQVLLGNSAVYKEDVLDEGKMTEFLQIPNGERRDATYDDLRRKVITLADLLTCIKAYFPREASAPTPTVDPNGIEEGLERLAAAQSRLASKEVLSEVLSAAQGFLRERLAANQRVVKALENIVDEKIEPQVKAVSDAKAALKYLGEPLDPNATEDEIEAGAEAAALKDTAVATILASPSSTRLQKQTAKIEFMVKYINERPAKITSYAAEKARLEEVLQKASKALEEKESQDVEIRTLLAEIQRITETELVPEDNLMLVFNKIMEKLAEPEAAAPEAAPAPAPAPAQEPETPEAAPAPAPAPEAAAPEAAPAPPHTPPPLPPSGSCNS